MALQPNTKKLYPQTSVAGEPIPADILLSLASCSIDFSVVPVDNRVLPVTGELIVFYGDETYGCWVKFATAITAPATDGTFVADLTWIPAGSVKVMDRNGADAISVVGAGAGVLQVEVASAYKDTRKANMIDRP